MPGNQQRASPLTSFFWPESVAIVGASDDPARISGRPLRYLLESGYKGAVFPVNPRRHTVQGVRAYPTLGALPVIPDVVLVVVAAEWVKPAITECAAKGVKSVVIFSAGFAEADLAGRKAQDEIVAIVRQAGMRMFGPNCVGLFNSESGFYGTFTQSLDRGLPESGPVAVVSQSGAYGADLLFMARERGLGIKYWLATGNEADLTVADGLLWMARQPDVKVIMCYAEGVRDGEAFIHALRVAHENRKPIVFLKSGRSDSGARAALSHTAAMAGSDAVYDALFRQYGVHRARTAGEQIDIAYACAHGVLPAGNRLGIVTISGGVGVQMCDAAERCGLEVPPMPLASQAKLKKLLPFAGVGNPCDTTAQALNDMSLMATNLDVMLGEGGYDALVAFFSSVPASSRVGEPLRQAIRTGTSGHAGTLMVLAMIVDAVTLRSYRDAGFLTYDDSDRAVEVIGALARLRSSFDRPLSGIPPDGLRLEAPIALGGRALSEHAAKKILADHGVSMLPERVVTTWADAVAAADEFGYPVALKIASPDIPHKTEIGGVLLNVADAASVKEGFGVLLAKAARGVPSARIEGVLVAPMAPHGIETIIGVARDPVFGPVVMFGLGGTFVEIFRDVTFRVAPFDQEEARRMMREVKGYALLEGARGAEPFDIDAVAKALAGISRFSAVNAAVIDSIDINPFLVLPKGQGAVALDAVIVPSAASALPG